MGLLGPASCSPPKTGCWDTCWGCWWACWIGCLKTPGCLEKFWWTVWNCWLICCCCCCCCCRDDGRLPSEGNFLSIKGGERCCWYIPPLPEGLPDLESKDNMNHHPPNNDFTYSTVLNDRLVVLIVLHYSGNDHFRGKKESDRLSAIAVVCCTNGSWPILPLNRAYTVVIGIGTPKYILQCCGCIRGWISATSPHPSIVVRRGVPVSSPGPYWPRRSAQLVPGAPADVRKVWPIIKHIRLIFFEKNLTF